MNNLNIKGFDNMRILVSGSGTYKDDEAMFRILNRLKPTVIITGDRRGAESLAVGIAYKLRIPCETYESDWHKLGRSAIPVRNENMLILGRPDLVAIFRRGENKGNIRELISLAAEKGIPVREYGLEAEADSGVGGALDSP